MQTLTHPSVSQTLLTKSLSNRKNRIEVAIHLINNKQTDCREFDNCFEMGDGDAVVCELIKKAKQDPKFKENLARLFSPQDLQDGFPKTWLKTHEQFENPLELNFNSPSTPSTPPLGPNQCYVLYNPDHTVSAVFHQNHPDSPLDPDPLTLLEDWVAFGQRHHLSHRQTLNGTTIIKYPDTPEQTVLGYYKIIDSNPKVQTVANRGAW